VATYYYWSRDRRLGSLALSKSLIWATSQPLGERCCSYNLFRLTTFQTSYCAFPRFFLNKTYSTVFWWPPFHFSNSLLCLSTFFNNLLYYFWWSPFHFSTLNKNFNIQIQIPLLKQLTVPFSTFFNNLLYFFGVSECALICYLNAAIEISCSESD
jgi:hypothetical protein